MKKLSKMHESAVVKKSDPTISNPNIALISQLNFNKNHVLRKLNGRDEWTVAEMLYIATLLGQSPESLFFQDNMFLKSKHSWQA